MREEEIMPEPIELGPVCEGCGKRTAQPTWFEMDPFCPACVRAENDQSRPEGRL